MDATKVILLPVKARYKQLIKEHGEVWNVVRKSESVQCFAGRPGVYIISNDGKHERWVEPLELAPFRAIT